MLLNVDKYILGYVVCNDLWWHFASFIFHGSAVLYQYSIWNPLKCTWFASRFSSINISLRDYLISNISLIVSGKQGLFKGEWSECQWLHNSSWWLVWICLISSLSCRNRKSSFFIFKNWWTIITFFVFFSFANDNIRNFNFSRRNWSSWVLIYCFPFCRGGYVWWACDC